MIFRIYLDKILQPDVTAPGVNIIAAFSEAVSPTGEAFDNRTAPFITMSGTSMSCPHVAGLVGLLRTLHPHWSPSAIKSAIMTSARVLDNTMKPMLDGGSPDLAPATPSPTAPATFAPWEPSTLASSMTSHPTTT